MTSFTADVIASTTASKSQQRTGGACRARLHPGVGRGWAESTAARTSCRRRDRRAHNHSGPRPHQVVRADIRLADQDDMWHIVGWSRGSRVARPGRDQALDPRV